MSRATTVYVAMLILCAGGLWGIVRIGGRLRAPPSLAGTWDIDPPATPATATGLGASMTVEQSGRFVQVRFASGRTLDLKLDDGPPAGPDPTVTLAGGGWRWSGPLTDGGRTMAVRLDGPEPCTFTARVRGDTQPGHDSRAH